MLRLAPHHVNQSDIVRADKPTRVISNLSVLRQCTIYFEPSSFTDCKVDSFGRLSSAVAQNTLIMFQLLVKEMQGMSQFVDQRFYIIGLPARGYKEVTGTSGQEIGAIILHTHASVKHLDSTFPLNVVSSDPIVELQTIVKPRYKRKSREGDSPEEPEVKITKMFHPTVLLHALIPRIDKERLNQIPGLVCNQQNYRTYYARLENGVQKSLAPQREGLFNAQLMDNNKTLEIFNSLCLSPLIMRDINNAVLTSLKLDYLANGSKWPDPSDNVPYTNPLMSLSELLSFSSVVDLARNSGIPIDDAFQFNEADCETTVDLNKLVAMGARVVCLSPTQIFNLTLIQNPLLSNSLRRDLLATNRWQTILSSNFPALALSFLRESKVPVVNHWLREREEKMKERYVEALTEKSKARIAALMNQQDFEVDEKTLEEVKAQEDQKIENLVSSKAFLDPLSDTQKANIECLLGAVVPVNEFDSEIYHSLNSFALESGIRMKKILSESYVNNWTDAHVSDKEAFTQFIKSQARKADELRCDALNQFWSLFTTPSRNNSVFASCFQIVQQHMNANNTFMVVHDEPIPVFKDLCLHDQHRLLMTYKLEKHFGIYTTASAGALVLCTYPANVHPAYLVPSVVFQGPPGSSKSHLLSYLTSFFPGANSPSVHNSSQALLRFSDGSSRVLLERGSDKMLLLVADFERRIETAPESLDGWTVKYVNYTGVGKVEIMEEVDRSFFGGNDNAVMERADEPPSKSSSSSSSSSSSKPRSAHSSSANTGPQRGPKSAKGDPRGGSSGGYSNYQNTTSPGDEQQNRITKAKTTEFSTSTATVVKTGKDFVTAIEVSYGRISILGGTNINVLALIPNFAQKPHGSRIKLEDTGKLEQQSKILDQVTPLGNQLSGHGSSVPEHIRSTMKYTVALKYVVYEMMVAGFIITPSLRHLRDVFLFILQQCLKQGISLHHLHMRAIQNLATKCVDFCVDTAIYLVFISPSSSLVTYEKDKRGDGYRSVRKFKEANPLQFLELNQHLYVTPAMLVSSVAQTLTEIRSGWEDDTRGQLSIGLRCWLDALRNHHEFGQRINPMESANALKTTYRKIVDAVGLYYAGQLDGQQAHETKEEKAARESSQRFALVGEAEFLATVQRELPWTKLLVDSTPNYVKGDFRPVVRDAQQQVPNTMRSALVNSAPVPVPRPKPPQSNKITADVATERDSGHPVSSAAASPAPRQPQPPPQPQIQSPITPFLVYNQDHAAQETPLTEFGSNVFTASTAGSTEETSQRFFKLTKEETSEQCRLMFDVSPDPRAIPFDIMIRAFSVYRQFKEFGKDTTFQDLRVALDELELSPEKRAPVASEKKVDDNTAKNAREKFEALKETIHRIIALLTKQKQHTFQDGDRHALYFHAANVVMIHASLLSESTTFHEDQIRAMVDACSEYLDPAYKIVLSHVNRKTGSHPHDPHVTSVNRHTPVALGPDDAKVMKYSTREWKYLEDGNISPVVGPREFPYFDKKIHQGLAKPPDIVPVKAPFNFFHAHHNFISKMVPVSVDMADMLWETGDVLSRSKINPLALDWMRPMNLEEYVRRHKRAVPVTYEKTVTNEELKTQIKDTLEIEKKENENDMRK